MNCPRDNGIEMAADSSTRQKISGRELGEDHKEYLWMSVSTHARCCAHMNSKRQTSLGRLLIVVGSAILIGCRSTVIPAWILIVW